MYHIVSFYNVFGVTAILLLSNLSTFPVVSALDGYIEPGRLSGSVEVEQGTALHLNCTLSNVTHGSRTAVDIVWYKGSRSLPIDSYTAITDSVSQLSMTNVTFDQSSTYWCGFPEDSISMRIPVQVLIGTKPEPVKLECIIRNPDEYRCSWEETTDTHLRTKHQFQFRPLGGELWRDCPCPSCEENTCFVGIAYNTGGRQQVQVKSTNVLGEAVTTQSFDPYNDVVVNPPRDIVVSPVVTETSLMITWLLPDEWYRTAGSLEYRLRFKKSGCQMTNLTCCCWTPVMDIGRSITNPFEYKLQGLDPYTEYLVQLAARYGLDKKNWSEWTPAETVYTRETSPSETVGNLTAHEEDSLNNPYLRNVLLVWKELQVQNQHGIILGYKIEAEQTGGSEVTEELEWTSIITWFEIQGLQNYFPYQIKVAAYNQAGTGPWASVSIVDKTTAPNAPDWVQTIAVTMTSINVTWGTPSEPNGIIQSYIVQWKRSDNDENMQSYMTHSATHQYHVLEHLDTYVLYEVSVRVRNSRGDGGKAFAPGGGRTLPGVPDAAPTGLTVKPINDQPDSLTLAWEPVPITDINGDLKGYLIGYCQSKSSCKGEFLQHMNLSSPDFTSTTIKGLEPSTQYSVWLAAYTSVGVGPDSKNTLATTSNEASAIVVAAILGPLFIGVLILLVILCIIRQVINSHSIPDPKIARDVDVMKMSGVNGMYHSQGEEEIFDKMPSDDTQTVPSHTLELVVIEDLKEQKFRRSESNDSGFPPSPARSTCSANLDYLRDRLSNGDVIDSVFKDEHGRMQKDMDKKNSGFFSQISQSDSVGPYTRIGELPSLKIPPSSGLGPPSVKSPSVVETRLKGNSPSPSSPSVDVSPYTQMSTLLGSCPANALPGQQENQNRNKLPTVGSNENQTSQTKEVSPYTLMSAMSSMQNRQPKGCQEPSVGASKCKKQKHLPGSAPTLPVPPQMLAMEAIKQKKAAGCHNQMSPPESPSTVSPYSKLEDLAPPSFSAKSSFNNPTANSTQPVSPYIQMPEVNFLNPRQPQTNEIQQVAPKPTIDIQTHKPQLVLPQPVSPYIQTPEVKSMQPKHSQIKASTPIPPPCAVDSSTCNPSALTTEPAAPETLITDTAGLKPHDPLTKQANQRKELPSGISPNDSPSVFQQPVSPYVQAPGVNFLQLSQARTNQSKQHPPKSNKGHPPTPLSLQQSAKEQIQQQADNPRELPPDTDSNNTPPALSHPVTPYIQISDINFLQSSKQQTNQAKQSHSDETDAQPAQQQTVLPKNKLSTPQSSKQDIIQQQLPPGATFSNTPVLSQSVLPYIQMPESKIIEPHECHAKNPEVLPPARSSEGQTDSPSLILPQAVSPYMEIPEEKTPQVDQLQAEQLHKEGNRDGSSQKPLPPLSQTVVSEQHGSPYVQVPQMKSMQLSQQQATQPKDSQRVSPEPVSHNTPIPDTKTLEALQQQSPQSVLLHEVDDTESPTYNSAPVLPQAVSPYIQIPEITSMR